MFDKRLKYVRNDVDMWEMAKIFEKCLRYMGNDSCFFRNGISMLEMT